MGYFIGTAFNGDPSDAVSGDALICVESKSYCEFDETGQEIPSAILALESENRQRALAQLEIPTLVVDRSLEVQPVQRSRMQVWQYLAQDAMLCRLLKLGKDAPPVVSQMGFPCAGPYFRDANGNPHHFDIVHQLLSGSNPFSGGHLMIDDEQYTSSHRGFDATEMAVFRATQDIDGMSTISMAISKFRDDGSVAGFARVPSLGSFFLRANEVRLAEALACSRMKTRCEEMRRVDAAPDNDAFLSNRMCMFRDIGAVELQLESSDDYAAYVNEVLGS